MDSETIAVVHRTDVKEPGLSFVSRHFDIIVKSLEDGNIRKARDVAEVLSYYLDGKYYNAAKDCYEQFAWYESVHNADLGEEPIGG